MDILYISNEVSKKLAQYCDDNLLVKVIEHFAKNGKIVYKDNNGQPSRWWVVTDFIKDGTINQRQKVAVILSFAALDGFVQIEDRMERGNVNTLCMLKETGNISDEDFDFFVDAFFQFSNNNGVKFTI